MVKAMAYREYGFVSGVLFCLVAIAHLLRIVYDLPVIVDDYAVPMAFSWVGFVVPAALAAWALRLSRSGNPS